jgi:hypothetical protein
LKREGKEEGRHSDRWGGPDSVGWQGKEQGLLELLVVGLLVRGAAARRRVEQAAQAG